MKITHRQLRQIIKEELTRSSDKRNINEGIFGGALKGMVRKIPGVGDSIADAHTSSALDELDEKLTEMVDKLKDHGERIAALESGGGKAGAE